MSHEGGNVDVGVIDAVSVVSVVYDAGVLVVIVHWRTSITRLIFSPGAMESPLGIIKDISSLVKLASVR